MMVSKSVSPSAKIGFIGLGNMGYPMARNLVNAGYQLTVADLDQERLQRFCQETGSTAGNSLSALGAASQVVITMLPEGKAVRQVLLGNGGDAVVPGLAKGAILIDMSSSSPVGTRALGSELAALGYSLVDAPVSGGIHKAADGTLAIMVGGEPAVYEACQPLFAVLGKSFHTGGPASGHAMKAMNNYLSAATLTLTAEAVITGTRFGLDPKIMVDILNASSGRSNSSEQKFPAYILPRTFDSGFFLGLMAKDLRFALELAEAEQAPCELLRRLSHIYDAAEQELGFKADNTDIYRYLESLAGKEQG
ncbi:MAG: NAD(P)-dependent oxidoreductase [Pseudomonadales bacterium]|nr:NAD(P)-dependent oxidoreductase [Pseudomonadales bacterium]